VRVGRRRGRGRWGLGSGCSPWLYGQRERERGKEESSVEEELKGREGDEAGRLRAREGLPWGCLHGGGWRRGGAGCS